MKKSQKIIDDLLESDIGDQRISKIMLELSGIAGAVRGCAQSSGQGMLGISLNQAYERLNNVIEELHAIDREQFSSALDQKLASIQAPTSPSSP